MQTVISDRFAYPSRWRRKPWLALFSVNQLEPRKEQGTYLDLLLLELSNFTTVILYKVSMLKSVLVSEAPRGAPYSYRKAIWERKGNTWIYFLIAIMASVVARGRVRTTMTTAVAELRKMPATLQLISWQRHAALAYCVLLWYWTSMLWSIDACQNKVAADQYHVTTAWAQV